VSKLGALVATKLIKPKPYRTIVVNQLQPPDAEVRTNYCRWFHQLVYDGMVDPDLIFHADRAWFHLSGYVNCQNTCYWNAENPHCTHEFPLRDAKMVGVVCDQSIHSTVLSRNYRF
jgi:hypothetical protein